MLHYPTSFPKFSVGNPVVLIHGSPIESFGDDRLFESSFPNGLIGNPSGTNLIIQIPPFGVLFLDQAYLPCPVPLLQLLFTINRALGIVARFIVDEIDHVVLLGESRHDAVFVLPNSLRKSRCYTDIQCPIAFTCENVNVKLFFHSTFSVIPECLCREFSTTRHSREGGNPVLEPSGSPTKQLGDDGEEEASSCNLLADIDLPGHCGGDEGGAVFS